MKSYTITVNGVSYDVTVEENDGQAAAPARTAAPKASAPKAPAAAPKAKAAAAGAVKVNAPMPGKILAIKVKEGAAVSKGDIILVLEAMKMENEIIAPQDGTIAGINVSVGDSVEAGAILASLN